MSLRSLLPIAMLALAQSVNAQQPGPPASAPAGPPAAGAPPGGPSFSARSGDVVFQQICSVCHLAAAQAAATPANAANARAVPREQLHNFSPGGILTALTNGKMQVQGGALTNSERRAVAEFASGKTFAADAAATEKPDLCVNPQPMRDPAQGPSWNGWGNGPTNTRYQPKSVGGRAQGGLTAADLGSLELKWAFGYANVSSARAQPTIAGGRLFATSENGQVHALDPRTGCKYWTYQAQSGVVTSPVVGPYKSAAGKAGFAVFFADRKSNAYGVDAQTGQQLWVTKVDVQPFAAVTGSLTYYGGRVFVPIQGVAEEGTGSHSKTGCCTFRGNVTAVNTNTGEIVWKTYTVGESKLTGHTKDGVPTYGPSGGSIWSAATVDAKRKLVYVATGNGFSDPPQPMTDSVIAIDFDSGEVRWHKQLHAEDQWAMGCDAKNPGNPSCPATLGPDYDFSAPPALAHLKGRDLLILPQKAGWAWAVDPAQKGAIVWKYQIGQGSGLGGQWGGAIDGEHAYFGVADLLTPTPGGMRAVTALDGKVVWTKPPQEKFCKTANGCSAGQGGPTTAIPGAVFNAAMDGGIRAYSTKDGSVLWSFDTNSEFKTVNGVEAHGGAIDASGVVVVDGMVYSNSGYGGLVGMPGNVLLAFGLKR